MPFLMRILILTLAVLPLACGGGGGGGDNPPDTPAIPQLGDPNPGLTAAQRAAFERGRDVFERRFTQAEGHGPDFNTSSCKSCHSMPVTGGSAPLYRNFLLVARTTDFTADVPTGSTREQLTARP